ncbi:MAG: C10 family peptidase [Planctomycetota bacterium]
MKRIIILSVAAGFLVSIAWADAPAVGWGRPVEPEEAAAVVAGWLAADTTPLETELGGTVDRVDVFTDEAGPLYFVVHLRPTGFVIVPAYDTIEPILAFTSEGAFDPAPATPFGAVVPQDIRARRAAAAEMLATSEAGKSAVQRVQAKWLRLRRQAEGHGGTLELDGLQTIDDVRVGPLLVTRWAQTCAPTGLACFNYYTPGGGVPAWPVLPGSPNNWPCGCVATAMAQVMRYFGHPTRGINELGAISNTIWVSGVGYVTAQTRGGTGNRTAYRWDLMIADPHAGNPTEAQRQEIGRLCWDAGVLTGMAYSSGSSVTMFANAKSALIGGVFSGFQYTNAVLGGMPGPPIGSGLIGMVNPNLDGGRPVLLSLAGSPSLDPHAVVADGYGYNQGTLYHHINAGWAGQQDLWYNVFAADLPADYTFVDECIYNISKIPPWPPVPGFEVISGRVTDNQGRPVVDALVSIRATGFSWAGGTNARGIYAASYVPPNCACTVTASKAGYGCFPPRMATTGLSSDRSNTSGNVWGVDFQETFPGDLNCDQVVDFDDINPFVLALANPAGYAAAYPNCNIMNGDINCDGRVDFVDINPFVALLIGGGATPSSGTTATDGTVTFQYGPTRVTGTYTSTVTGVSKAGWTYASWENRETSDSLRVP